MPLTPKDIEFLAHQYNTYYQTAFKGNLYLTDFESREFALDRWASRVGPTFQRHLGFRSIDRYIAILKEEAPRHLYASAAHYQDPSASSMREKGWKDDRETNCDLIFDLDIDHIYTDCKFEHDKWVCNACGQAGKGPAPKICPNIACQSVSFKELRWECPKCLEIAKQQIIYLIEDFLAKDFGVNINNENELFITFSGRRGYHVHVEKDIFKYLSSNARREITDYVTGVGLDPRLHGVVPGSTNLPKKTDQGWSGRIVCITIQYLTQTSDEELGKFFRRRREEIPAIRNEILQDLNSDRPTWRYKGIGLSTLYKIIDQAVKKYMPQIDKPVTIDVHRLVRLPGSLHGKTGLLVKKLSFTELQDFDPYRDAAVFKGQVRVYVYGSPEFTLEGQTFGPYKEQAVTLPLSAAVFLLSHEIATISK